jgi:hypothetical protein
VDAKAFQRLGIPSPKSFVVSGPDLYEEIAGVIPPPSLDRVASEVGFPCFFKPVDGYGWDDVYEVKTLEELKERHASIGVGKVWLVQQRINYVHYYRVFCIDKKDVLFIRWIPRPLAMGEYLHSDLKEIEHLKDKLTELTTLLNASLDMDINVVEWCVDDKGQPWVIDAFNEVPDMPKSRIPEEYYWWIVERFAACIKDKVVSDRQNKHSFTIPPAQQP